MPDVMDWVLRAAGVVGITVVALTLLGVGRRLYKRWHGTHLAKRARHAAIQRAIRAALTKQAYLAQHGGRKPRSTRRAKETVDEKRRRNRAKKAQRKARKAGRKAARRGR